MCVIVFTLCIFLHFIIYLLFCIHYCIFIFCCFFFFKQKTAYEMRISDWSSDVCSSDLSDNFDIAAEWYYQPNSYASIDFFLKNVSNFIVGGTQRQTINGVIDPTTGQPAVFSVTQQVNGPEATVRGVELAWQHVFGNSGFGLDRKSTRMNSSHKCA